MEIAEIQSIYKTDPAKLVSGIIDSKAAIKDLSGISYKTDDFIKQFDPKGHKVLDIGHRPNKMKNKDGQLQAVPLSRLPVPLQKIIVKRAVSFLLGNPVKIKGPGENEGQNKIETFVKKLWQDSKLDYLNKDLARILFSETEVAEIWFSEPAEKGYWEGTAGAGAIDRKLRVKIVSEGTKDKLFPVFSKSRDLVAFGRHYTIEEAGEKIEQFDLYQETTVSRYAKKTKDWEFAEEGPHGFDKMPVIYYKIDWPLWFDVQEMIERFETRLSNFADTNDYFGDPIVTVKGEVTGFADKGESGKLLQLTKDAEAKYLTWEHAPESTKLEFETLIKLIFSMTQTPDISFESVKGIGQVSGVALELLFLDAHLKAKENETFFGLGIQRRLNFLTHAAALLMPTLKPARQTVLEPQFVPYMPSNTKEMVAMLSEAVGGKAVMSISTAVKNNPLVSDPAAEMELIKEDTIGGLEE